MLDKKAILHRDGGGRLKTDRLFYLLLLFRQLLFLLLGRIEVILFGASFGLFQG